MTFLCSTIMLRTLGTLLFAFYTLGVLMLPKGDLRILADLPAMYHHCKDTEHHDMNVVDFITDHLLPFDAMVDPHPPGDEQRPHSPPDRHHTGAASYAPLTKPVAYVTALYNTPPVLMHPEVSSLYHFDPLVSVFRPPCA